MKLLASAVLILTFSVFAFSQQQLGSTAQDFNAVKLNGETFELNQIKGKVTVLTFWSTKCLICVAEIPKLNKLFDKYHSKDVEFIGLTMNHETMVSDFIKKHPFKFTLIPNSLGVVLKYADRDSRNRLIMGYPAHYIISQKGEVVLKTSGWDKTEKLDNKIAGLLKQ